MDKWAEERYAKQLTIEIQFSSVSPRNVQYKEQRQTINSNEIYNYMFKNEELNAKYVSYESRVYEYENVYKIMIKVEFDLDLLEKILYLFLLKICWFLLRLPAALSRGIRIRRKKE